MTRLHFQALAEARIAEAKILLDNGQYAGAYYLAGYAVECALKACIFVRQDVVEAIFKEKSFAQKFWTHDLQLLIDVAGLKAVHQSERVNNVAFDGYWLVVADWDEQSRYLLKTEADARTMYNAVVEQSNGVLPWIKQRW